MTNPQRVGSPPAENVESNRLYPQLSVEHFLLVTLIVHFLVAWVCDFCLGFSEFPNNREIAWSCQRKLPWRTGGCPRIGLKFCRRQYQAQYTRGVFMCVRAFHFLFTSVVSFGLGLACGRAAVYQEAFGQVVVEAVHFDYRNFEFTDAAIPHHFHIMPDEDGV